MIDNFGKNSSMVTTSSSMVTSGKMRLNKSNRLLRFI